MKKTLILITVMLFGSVTVAGFQEKRPVIDGHLWKDADVSFKVGYLAGLHDGAGKAIFKFGSFLIEGAFLDKENVVVAVDAMDDEFYYYYSTYEQMIDGLDEFYKDYANKKIPVYRLLTVVCKRASGKIGEGEIEKELQKLRVEVSNQ